MTENALAGEPSPYLRLHATNPVAWLPWSAEAFARARAEDKPIFLSIGYYTCHWCHVMERESFADPALAELLNRDFISIKVDREERPDVDRLYMAFVQATTGGGGWPLSVFLTPELKPFYGGTYYPPRDRPGTPSFRRVLEAITLAWRDERPRLLSSAGEVGEYLQRTLAPAPAAAINLPELHAIAAPKLWDALRASFDATSGGFGGAPKFPRPATLSFLLHHAVAARAPGDDRAAALDMCVATLQAMAAGGIHDVLGGGFHRYATDAGWLVPHFEKMLYDQAQLAIVYLQAWQMTRLPELAAVARSTLDFVLREMRDAGGGFYSAQDADSPLPDSHRQPGGPTEGEGAYYLWTQPELEAALGPGLAPAFLTHYNVLPAGNVPPHLDPQAEFRGKNILHGRPADLPGDDQLELARARLYQLRRTRPLPPTDDKLLTAWNGLMLSALALAAQALDEPRYLAAAQATAAWVERERWSAGNDAVLLRTAAVAGFVEDYAYWIQGLLDLHQADFDPHWLAWAHTLQQRQDALFAAPGGGYFSSTPDPNLWMRLREEYDGAEPSPNSVSASNLLRLAQFGPTGTPHEPSGPALPPSEARAPGDQREPVPQKAAMPRFEPDDCRQRAERLLASFASRLESLPEALPLMTAVLGVAAAPPRRLLIRGTPAAVDTRALLAVARQTYLPGQVLILEPAPQPATAYLCDDYTCQLPISSPEALLAALAPAS